MSNYIELPLEKPCPKCGNPLTLWFNDDERHIECSKCRYTSIVGKENEPGKENDPVNSPSHYVGKIECIDYLRDKLTQEEFTGFCMGNVLKYSSRWRKKDGLQDLKKAKVYLEWAIENEEKTEANINA